MAPQISLVKWFRNEKGKIVIEKKEQLASRGISSPDHAEALMLTFEPERRPLVITEAILQRAARPNWNARPRFRLR